MLATEVKSPGDVVTEIDRAAEQMICNTIWAAFPHDAVVGEEGGALPGPCTPPSGFQWVVDPLDGTYNFVHGFPHCAVSIAGICAAGTALAKTVVAVVVNPFNDECFSAEAGAGAFCNGAALKVGMRQSLSESIVGVVIPGGASAAFDRVWPRVEAVARKSGQIRRTGAAALDLAYVAAGRLDAFFVMSLRRWDIAAGALLVTEAGGIVTDLTGGNRYLETEQIIAGNAQLVPQLVSVLKSNA
jgi:myo-inositol-1(or 4)-monophosphatase